jgi:hypothetical protein
LILKPILNFAFGALRFFLTTITTFSNPPYPMNTNPAESLAQANGAATGRLHEGSLWLLNAVMAGLRSSQPPGRRSLRGWCLAKGEDPHLARNACFGTSNTKEAQRVRRKLIRAAGLTEGEN